MVAVKGLEKFSPRDYPGYISATIFLGGCNFRCPFCHNRQLVLEPEKLADFPADYFLNFLDSRKDWLDAVCVTGGEPLIHRDLGDLLRPLKERGLRVKIDTNGTYPGRLETLLREDLIDFVAMDVKAAPGRYGQAAGVEADVDALLASIALVRDAAPDYLFRTTVVPGLVDKAGIEEIGRMIRGARQVQLQQFHPGGTLDRTYESLEPYPADFLRELAGIMKTFVADVRLAGV